MLKKDFLVKLRKDAKLTRDAIEKLAGIPARTIGAYERGELKIYQFTEYANILSSISGVSPYIFNKDEINESDVACFELTKFSQYLRQYLLWSGIKSEHLNINDTPDKEVFNWLIDARVKQSYVRFKEEYSDYLDDFVTKNGDYFVECCDEREDDRIIKIEENIIELSGNDYKRFFFRKASKIILEIGNFKPSTMGINPSDVADVFFGETPKRSTVIYDNEEGNLYYDLVELEKNGLEFNYENVKRSISEGVLLNDEEKELLDLWKWAGDTLKEGIIQALRDNKERDLKATQEIMKLSGMTPKD